MKELAKLYREAQFYAHMAHNLASGKTFFEDHEFFGEAYAAYESAYDSVVERMIGLGESSDMGKVLVEINKQAAADARAPHSNEACFLYLLGMEKEICAQIAKDVVGATQDTQNLLQGLCDEGEVRSYKIQQRLK